MWVHYSKPLPTHFWKIFSQPKNVGYPERDTVILKLDAGERYKYIYDDEGTRRLADLWLKTSDVHVSTYYNPKIHNNYVLFTRSNPKIGLRIPIGNIKVLNESNFDPFKKTVVLVHGWLNKPDSPFNVFLTQAYLTAEDVNLIMVDWSSGADTDYIIAILNCIKSGGHAAKFISWLNSVTGASVDNYHAIGHSLGAHQVGIIGRMLDNQVAYITALDPAFPGWVINPYRFSPEVGKYTEAIHTNAGELGILFPAGDVDFYPNQGWVMPGCRIDWSCNHYRSVLYMGESLVSGGFTGVSCNSLWNTLIGECYGPNTLKMGGRTPKTGASGIYYLTTNAGPKYSKY